MLKKFIIFSILLFSITFCFAESRFLLFGIAYPLTQNKSKDVTANVSLSLLQNSVGEISGVNLCGFSAVCKGKVSGVQGAFLYSQIDDDLTGVSIAPVNVVNNNVKGIQLGIGNIIGRDFLGFQICTVVNFVGDKFKGFQVSTLFNMVGSDFKGLQFAGGCNVTGGNLKGVQIGSTFNFTGKKMNGLQWSGVNVAGEMDGYQIGYINISQRNKGMQIGIINIGEEQNGIPVGLVNLSDDGEVRWQNYLSNFAGFITAVKFESNNFVSTLEVGGTNRENDIDESVMFGFHYGYKIPFRKFTFEVDAGYFHVLYEPENVDDDLPNSLAVQLRISGNYRLTNWLELFGGIGVTAMGDYESEPEAQNRLLYFAGINLF